MLAAFLSLGLSFHGWTPWRLLVRAPLMDNIIPSRFGLVVYLCAAVMLGVVCDHTYRAVAGVADAGVRGAGRRPALLVAAVAPGARSISYFADGLPLTATPVRLPEWFRTVAPDLPADQVLLVFPFAFRQSNMTWQAVDRMRFAMVGGGGPDSIPCRAGKERAGRALPGGHLAGRRRPSPSWPGEVAAVRGALDGWGVTGVVLPDPRRSPRATSRCYLVRTIVVLMTAATGAAPVPWPAPGCGRGSTAPARRRAGGRPAGRVHGRSADGTVASIAGLGGVRPGAAGRTR